MDNYGDGLATGMALGQNNAGAYGGMGAWGMEWIWIIVLFALWGGNGFGFGGGNGGSMLSGIATRNDLCEEFNFNNLENSVRGISDSVNVGFANLNSTICNQQYDTARMIDAMNVSNLQQFNAANVTALQGFNGIQAQIAQCCCDVRAGQAQTQYEMAQNTCALQNTIQTSTRDIIESQTAGTQRILDYLCAEKISSLQTENAVLAGQLSQNAQTTAIISALAPKTPIPAYPVFPTTSFAYPTGVTFGVNGLGGYGQGGCGCTSIF